MSCRQILRYLAQCKTRVYNQTQAKHFEELAVLMDFVSIGYPMRTTKRFDQTKCAILPALLSFLLGIQVVKVIVLGMMCLAI